MLDIMIDSEMPQVRFVLELEGDLGDEFEVAKSLEFIVTDIR